MLCKKYKLHGLKEDKLEKQVSPTSSVTTINKTVTRTVDSYRDDTIEIDSTNGQHQGQSSNGRRQLPMIPITHKRFPKSNEGRNGRKLPLTPNKEEPQCSIVTCGKKKTPPKLCKQSNVFMDESIELQEYSLHDPSLDRPHSAHGIYMEKSDQINQAHQKNQQKLKKLSPCLSDPVVLVNQCDSDLVKSSDDFTSPTVHQSLFLKCVIPAVKCKTYV